MSEDLNDPPLPQLSPANRELENALAALSPSSSGISRDELLFRAGRASVPQPDMRFWKIATSLLIVASLGALYFRPVRVVDRPVEKIVHVYETKIEYAEPMPVVLREEDGETKLIPQVTFDDLPANCYLRLRNDVLTQGLTAIPPNRSSEHPAPRQDETSQTIWRLRQNLGGAF
jgi:hypothetical protein